MTDPKPAAGERGGVLELDTKSVAEDGTFTGYASVFGAADLGRDVVLPGAFLKSLASRPAGRVKMLRGHDQSEPVGVWTSIVEDAKGLKVTGRLILETARGRETHALLKAGAIDGLSIGYATKAATHDRAKGLRLLQEVDLLEISIVTFPMNPLATVGSVKSGAPAITPTQATELLGAISKARAALSA